MPRRSRLRRALLVPAVLALAATPLLGGVSNADTGTTGTITGTVTAASDGTALADIHVTAVGGSSIASATTDAAGQFTTPALAPGAYTLEFSDSSHMVYVTQWYAGKTDQASAEPVTVTAGQVTAGIDVAMQRGGTIQGTVTDGQNPVAGAGVYLDPMPNGIGMPVRTDATGHYVIGRLTTAVYHVKFTAAGYLTQWYPGTVDAGQAMPVQVTTGADTTGIDAVLVPGGTIEGTITDGIAALPGKRVIAYTADGSIAGQSTSDDAGHYLITSLPTGSYRVQAQDPRANPTYVDEWYAGTADEASAEPVSVAAGQSTTGIDITMPLGGSISGAVTSPTGPASVSVAVVNTTGDVVREVSTDSNGQYQVAALAAGNYRVEFTTAGHAYVTQWYPNELDQSSAEAVSVTLGTATTGIDAVVARVAPGQSADLTGDDLADYVVYRPSTGAWFDDGDYFDKALPVVGWGQRGDIPVPADYDGNGTADIAVYRPSNGAWLIKGQPVVGWGKPGDVPVPGDYDGNGTVDIAVYRPSTGAWFIKGQPVVGWGKSGDIPVPGDYDGNGTTDIAVYRPTTGAWLIKGQPVVGWGKPGDVPVPADYASLGRPQIAVYRPSTGAWLFQSGWPPITLGQSGDIPVPGNYDGECCIAPAVYHSASGRWTTYDGVFTDWGRPGDIPLELPYAVRHLALGLDD